MPFNLEIISFGDVFLKEENEYVFLAGADEYVYAAKILDREKSREVENYCIRAAAISTGAAKSRKIFYIVKLTSENFKDRSVHLYTADNPINMVPYNTTGLKLNDQDKKEILQQIKDPTIDLSSELKELISEISI